MNAVLKPEELTNLKQAILTRSAQEVYHSYMMGQDVWLFSRHKQLPSAYDAYDELKAFIATSLKVAFNDIAIIGSAKTGFSFSPTKNFRIFSDESDLDLALVSRVQFTKLWDGYLEIAREGRHVPDYKKVTSSVFRRFISVPETLNIEHEVFINWQKLVGSFRKDIQLRFGIGNSVNYRIYDSWESVEGYHLAGINSLKNNLIKKF